MQIKTFMERHDENTPRAEEGQKFAVRICECGVVARDYAKARCGRDGVRNIRAECPSTLVAVQITEVFPDA